MSLKKLISLAVFFAVAVADARADQGPLSTHFPASIAEAVAAFQQRVWPGRPTPPAPQSAPKANVVTVNFNRPGGGGGWNRPPRQFPPRDSAADRA